MCVCFCRFGSVCVSVYHKKSSVSLWGVGTGEGGRAKWVSALKYKHASRVARVKDSHYKRASPKVVKLLCLDRA